MILGYYGSEGDQVEIGMPVYMDDINAGGDAEDIRRGIRKLREMEITKKTTFGLKKTVILIVGKGTREEITEEVEQGRISITDKNNYVGIILNEKGNLQDHIVAKDFAMSGVCNQIIAIGSPSQVSGQFVIVRLELFQKCLVPALIYGLAAWGSISEVEINLLERVHGKYLKKVLKLPCSTPYAPMIMETGMWTFKERLKYTTMMLYHEIMNSDDQRKSKEIIMNQVKHDRVENTIYGRVKSIGKEANINIANVKVKKSKWKRICKESIIKIMKERLMKEMRDKTKSRIVREDVWGRKEYINKHEGWISIEALKIRLNMWQLKMNYKKNEDQDLKCPRCKIKEDTTEHVLECYSKLKSETLKDNGIGHWEEVVKVFQERLKEDES